MRCTLDRISERLKKALSHHCSTSLHSLKTRGANNLAQFLAQPRRFLVSEGRLNNFAESRVELRWREKEKNLKLKVISI